MSREVAIVKMLQKSNHNETKKKAKKKAHAKTTPTSIGAATIAANIFCGFLPIVDSAYQQLFRLRIIDGQLQLVVKKKT